MKICKSIIQCNNVLDLEIHKVTSKSVSIKLHVWHILGILENQLIIILLPDQFWWDMILKKKKMLK